MLVREAKTADRGHFQRLWLAALIEQHKQGSDMLPTGRNAAFGLSYFNSYVSGSRFGACLLWLPEGGASPQGFTLFGERWSEDDYDRDVGRSAWLWSIYTEPTVRRRATAGLELLSTTRRVAHEMGFDTICFNIPEGCPSGPLARRFGAKPRGVWYALDLDRPREDHCG